MNTSDLIICVAYFSIPIQILVSLWQYPRLALMPAPIFILLVLFAFFIFLCGAGHLLRCLEMAGTQLFHVVNTATAVISLVTALYLLPLVPSVFGQLDKTIADLKQLNKEANESKKKLFTFMAFLCHEIRNPLFAITSSATCCLEDTDLTEEQAIAVGSIMDSSVLMLRLVNDVLDLSKIDAGKLQLEEKTFDLHRMLDNLSHNIGRQIMQKSTQENKNEIVDFNVIVGDCVPQLVCADPVRLLQIIYNLLSNALKFTSQGRIDLEITVCSRAEAVRAGLAELTTTEKKSMMNEGAVYEDDGADYGAIRNDITEDSDDEDSFNAGHSSNTFDESNMFSMALLDSVEAGHASGPSAGSSGRNKSELVYLKICVTDTGEGIAPDRLVNIFEPYSQAKLSDYRKHGGTGLGLSIISGLTKAMGGKISATSTVNIGSSFVVQMPIMVATITPEQAVVQGISDGLPNTLSGHPPLKLSSMRLPNFQDNRTAPLVSEVDSTCDTDDSSSETVLSVGLFNIGTKQEGMNGSDIINRTDEVVTATQPLFPPKTTTDNDVSIPQTSQPNNTAIPTTTMPVPTPRKKAKLEPLVLPPNDHVVLVVDDNQVNQKIIAKMLAHFQIEYRVASNGLEAVDLFLNESRNIHPNKPELPRFALVFMDLCMPIMDGYDAITELRKHGVAIPIVALTANALQRERDRAKAVGATDFQTKPILRKELHQVCKDMLQAPLAEARRQKAINSSLSLGLS